MGIQTFLNLANNRASCEYDYYLSILSFALTKVTTIRDSPWKLIPSWDPNLPKFDKLPSSSHWDCSLKVIFSIKTPLTSRWSYNCRCFHSWWHCTGQIKLNFKHLLLCIITAKEIVSWQFKFFLIWHKNCNHLRWAANQNV